MPFFTVLRQPWCLFSLSLLVILLLVAAALVARSRRPTQQPPPRSGRAPRGPERIHELAASAPFEALQALGERLAELQRHLPPESADALWLHSYRNDLRNVTDDLYWELADSTPGERADLLARLAHQVEHLDHTISQHLLTTLSGSTDRDALHQQLEQLRGSMRR